MPGKRDEMPSWRTHKPGARGDMTRISTAGQRSAEGNDAFLWSLADLMTLLLIFFIMLYSNAIEHGPTSVKHPEEKLAGAQAVTVDDFGVFTEGASEMPILQTEGVNVQAAQADPPRAREQHCRIRSDCRVAEWCCRYTHERLGRSDRDDRRGCA